MLLRLSFTAVAGFQVLSLLLSAVSGQQFQGDVIPNQLPLLPGSEIAFWKITDKKGRTFTQTNYFSQDGNAKRLNPAAVKRAVIIIHGLQRDPGNYMANMLSALDQLPDGSGPDFTNTQIIAPYFPNGDDKNTGYPWDSSLPAGGYGSTSNALVWKGSGWISGDNNQYPRLQIATSSFDCLDQIITYFANKTIYPNLNQIVIGGHSAGAQLVQRYAAVGKDLTADLGDVRLTYWVGNPNSFAWLDSNRPLDTSSCPTYNDWRDGLSNYGPSYNKELVAAGSAAVIANYQSKSIAYVRGLQDKGDTSSGCEPFTTGGNRDDRFFNFIDAFPPTCDGASDIGCDTIDYVDAGHDASVMFADRSGQARFFLDNFNGDLSRASDFYCPRQVIGDNPFPNNTCTETLPVPSGTYNGMTYQGCWSDQDPRSLATLLLDTDTNSVAVCTQACAEKGFSLAGMEYGRQCFCGNNIAAKAEKLLDRGCYMACVGNASQFCGGDNRLSIWGTEVPEVLPEPTSPDTIGDYEYAGCFYDNNPAKALTALTTAASNMTLEICAAFCDAYTYWGIEYSQECYCGNILSAGNTKVAESDCSMLCAGDDLQFCGNGNRLTLYSLNGAEVVYTGNGGTSVTTTSSTVPVSTAPATGDPSLVCPDSDGTVYTSASGKSYKIMCGIDHAGGDLTSLSSDTFSGCIDACASTEGCLVVAYSGSACYLKSTIGEEVVDGVWGAILVSSISPSSVVSVVTSSSASSTISTASAAKVSTTSTSTSGFSSTTSVVSSARSSTSSSASTAPTTTSYSSSSVATSSTAASTTTTSSLASSSISSITGSSTTGSSATSSPTTTTSPATSSGASSIISFSAATSKPTSSYLASSAIVSSSIPPTTASSTTSSSTTSAPAQTSSIEALGCFIDEGAHILPVQAYSNSSNTPGLCAVACRSKGYQYSGVEYGSECWCGDTLPSNKASATDCSITCPGDAEKKCGAGSRMNVAVDLMWKQTFFLRERFSTWSVMSCYQATIPQGASGAGNRTVAVSLGGIAGNADAMNVAKCLNTCRDQGYEYCGLEWRGDCWGSSKSPSSAALIPGYPLNDNVGCNQPCGGNATEACGGWAKVLVYVNNGTALPMF